MKNILQENDSPRYKRGHVIEVHDELICSSYDDAQNVRPWEHRNLKSRQCGGGELVEEMAHDPYNQINSKND